MLQFIQLLMPCLGQLVISYTEKQLNRDFSREEFYAQFGKGSTFPQVLKETVRLGGCTETVRYLRENNLI
jgi:hypothetical protein